MSEHPARTELALVRDVLEGREIDGTNITQIEELLGHPDVLGITNRATQTVTDNQRAILFYRYTAGLSHAKIDRLLGISEGDVVSIKIAARDEVREATILGLTRAMMTASA